MADRYSHQIARIAVAQMAETTGFDSVQESAVEVLADLMLRYVAQLASASHSYAEVAGRTDCNVNDLNEIPFAHPLPEYPVRRKPSLAPTFAQRREAPPAHIPTFLPAFPDKHTYKQTPAFTGHSQDAKQQRLNADKARRQAEKSLVKLHDRSMPPPPPQKISSLGRPQTPRAASSMGPPAARLKHSNPFLAPPSWEEASAKPAALTAEPVPAQDISLLEQGAQFGDEEEEDEAAPMEGLADALPDTAAEQLVECQPQHLISLMSSPVCSYNLLKIGCSSSDNRASSSYWDTTWASGCPGSSGQWLEWRADEAKDEPSGPSSSGLGIPFMLDMTNNMRHRAMSARLHTDAKDAFAAVSDDEQDTAIMPGALKAGQKTKRFQQRDPGLLQAEQILKAGSHAINLYQDQLRQ